MSAFGSSKVEEALAHIKEAEKSLKTGLLKWKPDYDTAADEYNKAATCYRTAKVLEKSIECLLKACEYYKLNNSRFSAAKCLDQALLFSKEMGKFEDIPKLAHRACGLFQENGSPDTGALSLDRAAKMVEQKLPEEAIQLYLRACDVVMIEDRPRQGAEYMGKAVRLMVRQKHYDKAVDAIRKEMGLHQAGDNSSGIVGRCCVGLVLIHLARDDSIAADKAFQEWGSCCEQEEVSTLASLMAAYDQDDGDAAKAALNSPFIKHMDVEFARLAREVKLPQGYTGKVKKENDAGEEEEEEEYGLC